MELSVIVLVSNTVGILLAVILVGVIMYSGRVFSRNTGDPEVQNPAKFRILRCLVALVIIGVLLAVLNILVDWGFIIL